MSRPLWALSAAALCGACSGSEGPAAPPPSSAWFEEQAESRGLRYEHRAFEVQRFDFPEIMGGGVALLDGDGDGDLDVLFPGGGDPRALPGARSAPRYFVNDGSGTFQDLTAVSGFTPGAYSMGAACGDHDQDGDVDVFLTGVGDTRLFLNEGGRFRDVTDAAGARAEGWTTSAGFLDFDADGRLDLFAARYVDWAPERELDCRAGDDVRDYCAPTRYARPSTALLLWNAGAGRFEDASARLGLAAESAHGLGVASLKREEGAALLVANDLLPNQAWIGADGGLVNRAMDWGLAVNSAGFAASGMGIHCADFDDDGDLDVFVAHLRRQGHSLFVQTPKGTFRDEAARCGLLRPTLPFTGFGAGFADFDNDGDLDLFVANGRVAREHPLPDPTNPYAEENQLFEQREEGRFSEVLPRGGLTPPCIASSRGAAFGDLDNDGGVDVVVVDWNGRARLLHNRAHTAGGWLGLWVRETHGGDAIGARVELVVDGRSRFRDVNPVYSYLASNDPRVHFGLGPRGVAQRLRVRWADGSVEEFPVPAAGAYHELRRVRSR
jgi:hypothetical protein